MRCALDVDAAGRQAPAQARPMLDEAPVTRATRVSMLVTCQSGSEESRAGPADAGHTGPYAAFTDSTT